MNDIAAKQMARSLDDSPVPIIEGTVTAVRELRIDATLPGAAIGTFARVADRVTAQVASLHGDTACLLPLGSVSGVAVGHDVVPEPPRDSIPCGEELLGRIVDPFGVPLDGGASLSKLSQWPLTRRAPDPLRRRPVKDLLETGIRVIDGTLSLGKGQRIGLFAGPGEGKSTLLGMLVQKTRCDVSVVCLVGERGREVGEFIHGILGPDGLSRAVVVLAPADAPPLVKVRALESATAIAEFFRHRGRDALLLVDSLTRVLRARRDMDLALGEAPARGGYPASAFLSLPGLLERAGLDGGGSVTGVYTVLTDGGPNCPVSEEARALLDGHVMLSSRLANGGRWPAVDVVASVSRVMGAVSDPVDVAAAGVVRRVLSAYGENEDLVLIGAYEKGTCRDTDAYLTHRNSIEAFLRQGANDTTPLSETRRELAALASLLYNK